MSTVFVSVTISLDGYIAPEEPPDDPESRRWLAQWMQLQAWASEQEFLRRRLELGTGGETGPDNDLIESTFARTGVSIMGKRMFDAGEHRWPENAPFRTLVFVVTHEVRPPWERPGGTTFHFVNDGINAALDRARDAAGGRDIRIAGGADTIAQYLNAGLVDEMHLAVAPVVLGSGIRLFDGIDPESFGLTIGEVVGSTQVTHLHYRVSAPAQPR